jgi:hypothetical protein
VWDAFARAGADPTVIGLANSRPGGERNHRKLNLLDSDTVSTFFRDIKPNCEYIKLNTIASLASVFVLLCACVQFIKSPLWHHFELTSFPLHPPHLPEPHSKPPTMCPW